MRWSNNNHCCKVKLVWKLIFLCHFIMSLVPITEIRFVLLKQQDIRSADSSWTCVTEWSSNNRSEWLVIISFHMVHTFHYSKGHKLAKTNFPNLTTVKLHRKDNRCSKFFEIGTGAESAYEYETEDDNYRSSLKHRNNWQSTNH